jgi:hypothetical protein
MATKRITEGIMTANFRRVRLNLIFKPATSMFIWYQYTKRGVKKCKKHVAHKKNPQLNSLWIRLNFVVIYLLVRR